MRAMILTNSIRTIACSIAITIALAGTAAAQASPTAPMMAPPADSGRLYIGVIGGMGSAHEFGGLAGGEIGFHFTPSIDVLGEGVWVQNAINGNRLNVVSDLTRYLQQTHGLAVTSAIEAPAWTMTGGIRYFLKREGLRPYVTALGGVARMTLRPTFTINSSDVTAQLGDYGVTLGADVTGSATKPAFGGGMGVSTTRGRWVIDLGARVLSVQTDGRPTNILGVKIGLLYGF